MEITISQGASGALGVLTGEAVESRRPPRSRRRLSCDVPRDAAHAERQATLLQEMLNSNAPPGVEALVRQIRDGWLSVLITGLPLVPDADFPATQFLGRWTTAVDRFYDCRGGAGQTADDSHRHPDTQWEQHWVRYEVRHFRGQPYL